MKKGIVCISNNLKYDNRVVRHIKSISQVMDEVHVSAQPVPDEKWYLNDWHNVSYKFFKWIPDAYPATVKISEIAKRLKIIDELKIITGILDFDNYLEKDICSLAIAKENEIQRKIIKKEKIKSYLSVWNKCESDENEYLRILCFLDSAIQWAETVSDIPANLIYCNDIDSLLCGIVHKKKYGSKLVYDVHDLYYDILLNKENPIFGKFLIIFEHYFINWVDELIGVSQSELEYLKKLHKTDAPANFIPNCLPKFEENKEILFKKEPHVPFRFYFHGIADEIRGVKKMIEAIRMVPEATLYLRCLPSPFIEEMKELADKEGVFKRIHFLEVVKQKDLSEAVNRDSDVGISLLDLSPNNSAYSKISLTNKFAEYLSGATPVMVIANTEQGNIVKEYGCGITIKKCTAKCIAKGMKYIIDHPERYQKMSQNAINVYEKIFSWEKYETKLQNMIDGLI